MTSTIMNSSLVFASDVTESCFQSQYEYQPRLGYGPHVPSKVCFTEFQVLDRDQHIEVVSKGHVTYSNTVAKRSPIPFSFRNTVPKKYLGNGFVVGLFPIKEKQTFDRCQVSWFGDIVASANVSQDSVTDLQISGSYGEQCLGSSTGNTLYYRKTKP